MQMLDTLNVWHIHCNSACLGEGREISRQSFGIGSQLSFDKITRNMNRSALILLTFLTDCLKVQCVRL